MPLLLVLISLAIQPVLVPRYAIVFTLGLAVVVGFCLMGQPRWVHTVIGLALLTMSCVSIRQQTYFHSGELQRITETAIVISDHPDLTAVFTDPLDLLPIAYVYPPLR